VAGQRRPLARSPCRYFLARPVGYRRVVGQQRQHGVRVLVLHKHLERSAPLPVDPFGVAPVILRVGVAPRRPVALAAHRSVPFPRNGTTLRASLRGGNTMRESSRAHASSARRICGSYLCWSYTRCSPRRPWPRHISATVSLISSAASLVRTTRRRSW